MSGGFASIAIPVAACLGGTWLFLRCTGHAARAEMERRQARFHALSEKAFGDLVELPVAAKSIGGRAAHKRGDRIAQNDGIARHRDGAK